MKYSTWFKWINASLILLIIIAFIGILPGSVEFAPNWPTYAIICLINLIICVLAGLIHKDMDNK